MQARRPHRRPERSLIPGRRARLEHELLLPRTRPASAHGQLRGREAGSSCGGGQDCICLRRRKKLAIDAAARLARRPALSLPVLVGPAAH